MKRNISPGLLIVPLILFSAFLVSCASGQSSPPVRRDIWQTEGWVDKDTYRLISYGVPHPGTADDDQKKKTAKDAAILNAQNTLMEKNREKFNALSLYDGGYGSAMALKSIIKNGTVIDEKYDAQCNCSIIYQIKAKGLHKNLSSFDVLGE